MKLYQLMESEIDLPPGLMRVLEEWSALHSRDRQTNRRDYICQKVLRYRDFLKSTRHEPLGNLFRGTELPPEDWDMLVNQQQPISVHTGLINSWTTNYTTGEHFMEEKYNSVLLEHSFDEQQVVFYFPDLWRLLPDTDGSAPAAVYEDEVIIYHPTQWMTLQPNMVIESNGPSED